MQAAFLAYFGIKKSSEETFILKIPQGFFRLYL